MLKRTRKDRLFIFVMVIVAGGIAYQMISDIIYHMDFSNFRNWFLVLADCLAIYAILYLLRNYRRMRKSISNKEVNNGTKKDGTH